MENLSKQTGPALFYSNDQSGNATYSNKFVASGTSFAAPHIAGIAAYLIENDYALDTPGKVELAVRNLMRPLGSSDPSGRPISMPNLSGQQFAAVPTVEWRLEANGVVSINGTDTGSPTGTLIASQTYSNTPFNISYQAYGANTCTITAQIDGVQQYIGSGFTNTVTSYAWPPVAVTNNSATTKVYRWDADCVSSSGQHGYATISLLILPAPLVASGGFYVDYQLMPNNSVKTIAQASTHNFYYRVNNVTSCTVTRWKKTWNTYYNTAQGPGLETPPYNIAGSNYYSWSAVQYLQTWNPGIKWSALQKPDGTYVNQTYRYSLACPVQNSSVPFTSSFDLVVTP